MPVGQDVRRKVLVVLKPRLIGATELPTNLMAVDASYLGCRTLARPLLFVQVHQLSHLSILEVVEVANDALRPLNQIHNRGRRPRRRDERVLNKTQVAVRIGAISLR